MLRRCCLLPVIFLAVWPAARSAPAASVSIPAWVEDNSCAGTPNFKATLNGQPARITRQLAPGSDQIILLVFDLTGSLSRAEAAKQAAIAAIAKLPSNTWIGLLRDQDGLHVLADPSPNRRPLIAAVRSLSNNGEPGFLETVDSALSLADAISRRAAVRVSVLYLTDGNIYAYREDYTNPVINPSDPYDLSRRIPGALIEDKISNLVGEVRSLEAPLFLVQVRSRQDPMNEVYESGLETLATATGGKAEICHSAAEIPDAVAALFDRMSNAWRLTLALPPRAHRDLQIHLAAECPGGDARLSWRTDLHLKVRQR
jgi:hypothetical protein